MDNITELSSKIKLDQVPTRLYRPESELELASLTRCEKIYTKIVETPSEGAADVAADIARQITRTVREKGRCVIGLGAGRAALDVYDELVKLYFADKVTFANVVAFNMSELGLGNVREDSQSTISRLYERLFRKVDIDPNNIHTFDPSATKENVHKLCKIYETTIDEYGGLDVVICQLTKTGGLAFNDPGSSSSSSCRLVLLSNETRQRIAESYQCEIAPDTAVTLGMSNLLSARKFYAVAWGEESIDAVYNCIEGKISDLYPASFLQMHRDVKLTIDLEAATRLTRINFPWKVTSCNWTPQLVRRAIVWLSQHTGKPVLDAVKHRITESGRQPENHAFDRPADGIHCLSRCKNLLLHRGTLFIRNNRKRLRRDRFKQRRLRPHRKCIVLRSSDRRKMRTDVDSAAFQHLNRDPAGSTERCCQPAGKMPAAAHIRMTVPLHIGAVIRMRGARFECKIVIISGARIGICDPDANWESGRFVFKYTRNKFRYIGFFPCR